MKPIFKFIIFFGVNLLVVFGLLKGLAMTGGSHSSAALARAAFDDPANGMVGFEHFDRIKYEDEKDDPPVYPAEIDALDGKEIQMLGFMAAYDSMRNYQRFLLINFPNECNFCEVPRLQEILFVEANPERPPPPYNGIVHVTGTMHLRKPGRKLMIIGDDPELGDNLLDEFLIVIKNAEVQPFKPKDDET